MKLYTEASLFQLRKVRPAGHPIDSDLGARLPWPHLRWSGNLPLPKALDVSPHPRADGLVQGEPAALFFGILAVFTSLTCHPGASPFAAAGNLLAAGQGSVRTVILVVCGDHLHVIQAAQSSLLCASHWRYFATPTGRYHGRTLIHSSLRRHPCDKGACTRAGSGPSRVHRRLLHTNLEVRIPLGHVHF